MIGNTSTPMAGAPPNSSLAMGMPEARVFLEPQNMATISSSVSKRKA